MNCTRTIYLLSIIVSPLDAVINFKMEACIDPLKTVDCIVDYKHRTRTQCVWYRRYSLNWSPLTQTTMYLPTRTCRKHGFDKGPKRIVSTNDYSKNCDRIYLIEYVVPLKCYSGLFFFFFSIIQYCVTNAHMYTLEYLLSNNVLLYGHLLYDH